VSLTVSLGAGSVVAALVGYVARFPLALRIVAVVGALLMVTGGCLAAWGTYKARRLVKAGLDAEGGTTAPPPASPDEMLSAAYRDGVRLRTELVWAGGAPRSAQECVDAERRAQTKAREWAERTWLMLLEHHPAHEREFYGPGDPGLGRVGFWLSAKEEMSGGRADSYIESKLDLLRPLLRRDQGAAGAVPADDPPVATRGRTVPALARLADITAPSPVQSRRPEGRSLALRLREEEDALARLRARVKADRFDQSSDEHRVELARIKVRVATLLGPEREHLAHQFVAQVEPRPSLATLLGPPSDNTLEREIRIYRERLAELISHLASLVPVEGARTPVGGSSGS